MKIKEFEEKVKKFLPELQKLCHKHKIDIRAKITAYGPRLEFFEIKENKNETTN